VRKAFSPEVIADRRRRLARAGVLLPASAELPPELLEPSPVKDPDGKVLEALLEERQSRRRNKEGFPVLP
jgi:hypothetical protein